MSILKSASWGAASLMGAALLAGPALADGMPSKGRIAAPESRACSSTGNVAFTSDYVFRGVSQSSGEAAVQGGVELSCGRFYVGAWGSSVSDNINEYGSEIDIYGGYKTTLGRFAFDVGFTYYTYPGLNGDANFLELKAGVSTEVWKGGTVGATAFYAFDNYAGAGFGDAFTYELAFSQALPKFSIFTTTFSAAYGHTEWQNGLLSGDDYSYWNAGVSLGFMEKWSLDLRYHDTDSAGFNLFGTNADERYVATLKYSF
jgi:uncharacterized protein (TIGR02001 family)